MPVYLAAADIVFSHMVSWVGSGIKLCQFLRIFLLTVTLCKLEFEEIFIAHKFHICPLSIQPPRFFFFFFLLRQFHSNLEGFIFHIGERILKTPLEMIPSTDLVQKQKYYPKEN